jgi:hypothetical protein
MHLLRNFIIVHLANIRPDHASILMCPEISEPAFQAAEIIMRTVFAGIKVHGVTSCFTPMYCR